jgi:predicted dehydrogenase
VAAQVAIVGAGSIARRHARACQETPAAQLAAVYDTRPEAAARLATEFGAPRHTADLDDLLACGPFDIAIIATWGDSHAALTERLAHSGQVRAILCEKPLCLTASEATTMIATTDRAGVVLSEAFKFRHHPLHLRSEAIVRDGRLGRIEHIRSTFSTATPPAGRDPALNWRFNRLRGGGALYDLGCYCLHHARWLMQAEPEQVQAAGRWETTTGVDTTVTATMDFGAGRSAQCWISFDAVASQTVEVYGTRGWLRIAAAWNNEDQPTTLEVIDGRGQHEIIDLPPTFQFALQLQHLCACLEQGQPPRIPATDGLAQMRALDGLYAALRSGQPVALTT